MKRDCGAFTVPFVLYFLGAIFVLSLVFVVCPPLVLHTKMDRLAQEVVREAELTGGTGESVMDRYEDYADYFGIEPTGISFDGTEYISGSKDVQINDNICVTITCDYEWFSSFLDGKGIDIEVAAQATGRSGVYHK